MLNWKFGLEQKIGDKTGAILADFRETKVKPKIKNKLTEDGPHLSN